ncbi:MAG: tRNA pseudouridine(55) synthase TruB [Bacteroidales bacterium]
MIEAVKEIRHDTDFKAGALILVNKPEGSTSFKIVKDIRFWIKKHYQIREKLKVGHAGTLDPLASGLLLVCTGKMTRNISTLQQTEKTYTGKFVFGTTTPSYDLETAADQHFPYHHLTEESLKETFAAFTGQLKQIPPLYSAVKVKGKRAYDLARKKDTTVELEKKTVYVHEFELLSYKKPEAEFRIRCSKGTYIRALARDVGKHLGSGAYLKNLQRIAIGPYILSDAFSLEDLEKQIREAKQTPA